MNKTSFRLQGFAALLCAAAGFGSVAVFAAQTDISSTPIASTRSAQVKPNIMLLMDTSRSMGWTHMPDEVEPLTGIGSVGYKNAVCNVLYYKPTQTYQIPKKPDGTFFPTPTFSAAPYAGFVSYYVSPDGTDLSSVDLSTSFKAYDDKTLLNTGFNDVPKAAYYYVYTGTQTLSYASAPCTDTDTGVSKAATGGGNWTRVIVGPNSGPGATDERTNFAVWYSYYRTRISLTKSAASLAFTPLTDSFRVGFITVQPKDAATDSAINPAKYVAISDFNSSQRNTWFSKLFSQSPFGASPSREGLARVGRHYAGKQDGINNGMTGDPVQYSCQQNFTIMTTDGYWNSQTESPGGGPLQLDGLTLVGNQDRTLTPATGLTPRPIWEGAPDSVSVVEDNRNNYSYADCGTYADRSTTQALRSTSQVVTSTSQLTLSTLQNLSSSSQKLQSTNQNLQSTSQPTLTTTQNRQSTNQRLRSTTQNLRNTSQNVATTTQVTQTVTIDKQSTVQNRQSTNQNRQSTTQTTQSTSQKLQSTSQALKNTTQNLQSTSQAAQTTQTTSQIVKNTLQVNRSTSQTTITTEQVRKTTSQLKRCDAALEVCSFVAPSPSSNCVAGGTITCETISTGPTLVASCTGTTPVAGNNYLTTICATSGTGPTGTASCTSAIATAANSYTTTTCNTVTSALTPVSSCSTIAAGSGNAWTATNCTNVPTGPTPVATCSPVSAGGGNSYTATTCSVVPTGPTVVPSCTASGPTAANSYTTTTCGSIAGTTTTNVPVLTCTPSGPTAANSYTTTTCPAPVVTTNVPAASCTAGPATAANSYTATTCPAPVVTTNVPVATCTASGATAANSYTVTTCPAPVVTGPTGVASCTGATAVAGNSYTATTCGTNNTTNVAVSTCTASGPTAANGYTTTTCPAPVVTTNVPVATCTASGATAANGYTTTTCPAPVTTTAVSVAACTPAGASAANSWTTTTCDVTTVSGPTVVATCTPVVPTAANGYQRTSCGTITSTTAVAVCVPSGPTAANGYTTTTCGTNNTTNVPVATCTASGPTAANNYTTTTCPAPVVTTNVPVATCTASSPTAANNFTTTTCPAAVVTTNVPVATCTASGPTTANSFTTTTCPAPVVVGPTGVASCAPVAASAGNSWTATTCGTAVTTNVPVATCTPIAASAGTSWKTTTCPAPVVTTNVPVATCTASGATAANSYTTTTCPAPIVTTNVPVASCTAAAANAGNNYTTTTCPAPIVGAPTGVAACVPDAASAANAWTATTCVTVPTSAPSASCTGSSAASGNSYTTTSCATNITTDVPVATCTVAAASAGNAWTAATCRADVTGPTLVPSCTPEAASAATNWVATTCVPRPGKKIQFQTTKTVTTSLFNNSLPIGVPSVVTTTGALTDVDGTCFQPGTEPALPVSRASGGGEGPNPPLGCTGWPCSTTNAATGGSVNSLADVAQYYYITPLRTGTAWPTTGLGSVPSVGDGAEDDRANWQHMTTFTIGLGVSGTLNYRSDYRTSTDPTSDFQQIRDPLVSKPWPLWPDPANYVDFNSWNNPRSIDDFWHTAVNGRGQYFSAGNPNSVIAGLSGALAGITARLSAGAAAGTSSLQPVAGDNLVFVGSYVTSEWTGDVKGGTINTSNGEIDSALSWSAQALLDARTSAACDTRNIYLMRAGATNNMVSFTSNTFACDTAGLPTGAATTGLNAAELAFFGAASVSQLSQYPSMTDGTLGTVNQRTEAAGEKLVNYLRGQRGAEDFEGGTAGRLFRLRKHVLGDVVGGQPVYVKGPRSTYQDAGYQAFKSANANRTPMVYVAANDGMLHALYAGSASVVDLNAGKEAWAVIPSVVLPNLYKLADNDYRNVHQFYVDGTPVAGDVRDASTSTWKTLLVGGLNAGGKGYYALDITDPAAPKALWEFKYSATCYDGSLATAGADCHLGLTFGKPIITKIVASGYPEGRWVVLVTSGYNNVRGAGLAGDGLGYLYVLDAISGNIIYKIATTDGSAAAPSGLAQVNAYIEDGSVNNTAVRVYGGDLLGNIWRFDVNDTQAPSGREATLLGQATSAAGTPQPITTRPELAELNGKPFVFVGTGRLLGASDFADTSAQSVYGISDKLTGTPVYSDLRTALKPLVLNQSGDERTTACTASAAACARTDGWVIDLPDAGERVNIDMKLVVSTLTFASNVPQSSACNAGGYSWFNQVDFATGNVVGGASSGNVVSQRIADGLVVGYGVVLDQSGKYRAIIRTTGTGSNPVCPDCKKQDVEVKPPESPGRRISWREIAQ
jgi:Tfp pilus tip-associated adhesin PilY1